MSRKRITVYHTNWSCYAREFHVSDIPFECLTDINYAFYDLRLNASGFYVPTASDPWADFDKPYGDVKGNFGLFDKMKKSGRVFSFGTLSKRSPDY